MAPNPPQPDADRNEPPLDAWPSRANDGVGHHVSEGGGRFNVLLTEDREHPIEHWTRQVSRLLEPQGVKAFIARSGREALDISSELPIHAAVVDLATPRDAQGKVINASADKTTSGGGGSGGTSGGGLWLLEVLNRQPQRPPVVVVNGRTYSSRQAQRMLNEALRLGAFSVLNTPVQIEALLSVIQRLLEREYHGRWPTSVPGNDPANKETNTTSRDREGAVSSVSQTPNQPTKTTFRFTMKFRFNKKP